MKRKNTNITDVLIITDVTWNMTNSPSGNTKPHKEPTANPSLTYISAN